MQDMQDKQVMQGLIILKTTTKLKQRIWHLHDVFGVDDAEGSDVLVDPAQRLDLDLGHWSPVLRKPASDLTEERRLREQTLLFGCYVSHCVCSVIMFLTSRIDDVVLYCIHQKRFNWSLKS